jgi:hypothetical protein
LIISPDLCDRPELFAIMKDIARKRAGDARAQYGRIAARALAALCIVAMLVAAAIAPMPTDAAPDSASDASALHPHKHRHKGPTPTPTPMALPPEVKAKVPVYRPGPVPFHNGEQLFYEASWLGIPAAEAQVSFRQDVKKPRNNALHKDPLPGDPHTDDSPRSRWVAEVWVKTTPYADVFYKMRDHMRENVAEDTLHTGWIHVDQHENSRLDTWDVTLDRPTQIVTVTKTNKRGTQSKQFIASDPWGPLSGAMMALSQDLTPGKTYAFDVFGGSQRYVFAFDVQARERIHTALGDFDAIRIVPDVWYVSDGKLRSQAHDTVLWVSADKRHLPLRIQSQAFIGAVYADLIKVEDGGNSAPSGPPPAGDSKSP